MEILSWPILILSISLIRNCSSFDIKKNEIQFKNKNKIPINRFQSALKGKQATTTYDYYQQLLKKFQTQDLNSIMNSIQQNQLTPEEIEFIFDHVRSTLAQQEPQQQDPSTLPNNFPSPIRSTSLVDLLSTQESSRPEDPEVQPLPLPNAPNESNFNENTGYIPALHGNPDLGIINTNASPITIIGLNSANSDNFQSSSGTIGATSSPILSTRLNRGDIDKCLKSAACLFVIAALGALGFTGAIGTGIFFGGKRKKRDVDSLLKQQTVMDILDSYEVNITVPKPDNKTKLTELIFHSLSGIKSPENESNAWKTHQDGANAIFQNDQKEVTNNKTDKVKSKTTNTNKKISDKLKSSNKSVGTYSSREHAALIHNKSTPSSKSNLYILKQDENKLKTDLSSKKSNKHNEIILNPFFPLEHRTEGKNKELIRLLRNRLGNIFSQIEDIKNSINVSSNYENKTETTHNDGESLNTQKDSIFSTLNLILNSNSQKTQTSGNQFANVASPFSSSKPAHSFVSLHDIENLQLQKHTEKESTNQKEPLPQQTIDTNQNINSLVRLLQQNNEKGFSTNNQDLSPLLQIFLLNQFQRTSSTPPPTPTTPNFIFQQQPPRINTNGGQNIVHVNTLSNILQDSKIGQQKVESVLSKLVGLLTKPRPNQEILHNVPSPAPTIIRTPQVPLQIPTPSPLQSVSAYQRLSSDTLKFYELLCQSILEPGVPLNRVTAYIAEKCLVMRFLNIIKE